MRGFGAESFDINLKKDSPTSLCNFVYVRRDSPGTLQLGTCWGGVSSEESFSVPLVPGDQLGARADPSGVIHAYLNHVQVAEADMSSHTPALGGGYIGLGAKKQNQPLELDDFGGGNH